MHVVGDDMDDESPGHTRSAGYELEARAWLPGSGHAPTSPVG
jgi:hypothetical protein